MKLLHTLFLTTILLFSSAAFAGKININNASAEQIASAMTGIGDSKAKAIVDYRSSHGKFKSVQDLENVDGIGSKTVAKNKDKITL
ncbi:MAG: helix-hairpin-helix domain-containing protein [Gammaproteobacteria bacterium]|nr:MAG: helix-hairpin-helix domain-containing protein [Gammaproteobacteria bacterium]